MTNCVSGSSLHSRRGFPSGYNDPSLVHRDLKAGHCGLPLGHHGSQRN